MGNRREALLYHVLLIPCGALLLPRQILGLFLLNGDRPLGAFTEAGTKTIAVFLADKPCFAIDNLESPFNAGWNTDATAVTFLLIYPDDLSHHFGCHIASSPWLIN